MTNRPHHHEPHVPPLTLRFDAEQLSAILAALAQPGLERSLTAILNSLESLKASALANTEALARIEDLLNAPSIVMTPGKPKDKDT